MRRWGHERARNEARERFDVYLHGSHEVDDILLAEFENTVQNADLVVSQGLFSLAVELQEGPARRSVVNWRR